LGVAAREEGGRIATVDLGPVDRITADAIGDPGMRTFFLQARAGELTVTVIVEKQQVQLLATSVLELLADLELRTGTGPGDDEMALEEPVEPRWRAGRMSIGYDADLDRFLLEVTEFEPDEGDDEDEDEDGDTDEEDEDPRSPMDGEPETIRLWATREQMLALSRYGSAVAERGRPLCQLCGNPMDPEGHTCPATNGHRKPRA
jgi:uncharacterized repeat protein (TIGR03847 family)